MRFLFLTHQHSALPWSPAHHPWVLCPPRPPRVSPSPLTPRGCPASTVKARFWGATLGVASSVQPPTATEQNMDPSKTEMKEGRRGVVTPASERLGLRWREAEAGPTGAAQLASCQHAATTRQTPGPRPRTKPPIRAERSQGLREILSVSGNKTRTQKLILTKCPKRAASPGRKPFNDSPGLGDSNWEESRNLSSGVTAQRLDQRTQLPPSQHPPAPTDPEP